MVRGDAWLCRCLLPARPSLVLFLHLHSWHSGQGPRARPPPAFSQGFENLGRGRGRGSLVVIVTEDVTIGILADGSGVGMSGVVLHSGYLSHPQSAMLLGSPQCATQIRGFD